MQHTKWKLFVLAEVPQAGQIRRRNLDENLVYHLNVGECGGFLRKISPSNNSRPGAEEISPATATGVVGCEGVVVPQITLYKYI